jgi:hypothetical protein
VSLAQAVVVVVALVLIASGVLGLVARAKVPAERARDRPFGAAFRVLAGVAMLGFALVDRAT